MSYQSINPFNQELVKTFDGLTDPQLESAIATAATFFEKWRALTFAERAAIVSRAAGIMRERADEFARPVTLEFNFVAYHTQDEKGRYLRSHSDEPRQAGRGDAPVVCWL